MTDIKKLKELKSDILDESTNYSVSSPEGTKIISNLKMVHDMEKDIEELEMKQKEIEYRDERERDLAVINAGIEKARIEAEERRSKRETASKWGLGILAAALAVFGVMEDEARPALKNVSGTIKSFFKF